MGVPDIYKVSRLAEGRSLQRAITAEVLAKVREARGETATPERVLKAAWPRDEQAALYLKAASSPTKTTDYISLDQIGAFRSIAPGSAALKLFDVSVKLDLGGITTLRIPNVTSLSANAAKAVFVAEGAPAPVVQLPEVATVLGPARKMVVIAGVTRELDEATPDTASTVIGQILADATNAAFDKTAFGTAAAGTAPAGLLHSVTPVTASTATDLYMAMAEDLAALVSAIGAAGIDPSDVVFIAGPREAALIKIRAAEFSDNVLVTLGLPAKSVAAFAPAAVYSGYQDVPAIEVRKQSSMSLHMEDTSPGEIVGSPSTVAAPVKSFFQQELIAIRVRAWAAWAVAAGGAQVINSVAW
jgi:hypothetical protein